MSKENISQRTTAPLSNFITVVILPFLRFIRDGFVKLYRKVAIFTDSFLPFIRKIKYQNFVIYYSRGTSLIEPIRFSGMYEEEMSKAIISELTKIDNPVFLDIGANIGLVSLNLLAQIPSMRVFAFEPGSHQSSLFEKTIAANNLQSRVILYKVALSFKRGIAPFAVHKTKDASGDGFLDTGRTGSASIVTVRVETIDNWWKAAGCPGVNVVKIDTEGSEFWVLQGAAEFLYNCKPVVFLEIHPENLRPYPYSAEDVINWLNEHDYALKRLNGVAITLNNLSQFLRIDTIFVARPIFVL